MDQSKSDILRSIVKNKNVMLRKVKRLKLWGLTGKYNVCSCSVSGSVTNISTSSSHNESLHNHQLLNTGPIYGNLLSSGGKPLSSPTARQQQQLAAIQAANARRLPPEVPKRTSSITLNMYPVRPPQEAQAHGEGYLSRAGYEAERYAHPHQPLKVSETVRKRQYRVGLNLFNKKPERGIAYLISRGFLENSPRGVARFLITRKGLSKQMIGEYLGNLQNPFNMAVLECFVNELDLSGMAVDVALRRYQAHFRLPGEAQKIERLVEAFARRYCVCNPDFVQRLRTQDTISKPLVVVGRYEIVPLCVLGESRLTDDVSQYPTISQSELETVLNYILSWPQRQCMCCYRDVKNFERFYLVVQSILCLSVCQLKQLKDELLEAAKTAPAPAPAVPPDNAQDKQKPEEDIPPTTEDKNNDEKESPDEPDDPPAPTADATEDTKNAEAPSTSTEDPELWSMQQKEKLMHIVSKVFLLNFPLYLACKHSALSRLDDLSAQEISNLSLYCDLHDTEIPAYLLRNVSLFCKLGGVCAMAAVFDCATQATLPLSMAHAIVAAVGNLKLWLNFRAVSQLFMPLRSKILKYMCTLEDKDLRVPAVKSMADFMWGAAKEPLDVPLTFDGDGLALAFKYFNSSTLTMRLAGVAQINAHIASHNELCAGESAADAEVAGQQLATWLTNNNIIEHLFGPNLHVEEAQAHGEGYLSRAGYEAERYAVWKRQEPPAYCDAPPAACCRPPDLHQHPHQPLKVSETVRKRQYRVGLNLFNKKPERGIAYLISRGFLENSPRGVARFLITRKGLSKQMIGEYLGNLQNPFNMAVLECFVNELDLSGMAVDVALRRYQAHFRLPGEAQKIERLVEAFARRYCVCNPDFVQRLRTQDTIFVLAFAIIMLNTDLHTPNLKPEARMSLDDFVRNLRGIDDCGDIDRDMLSGIYDRVKSSEFRPGSDHVTQVMKVQATIVGKKPHLALPHRRLVCYCRLYEIPDIHKKERPGVHQREVFLFNDLLVITKIFSKKKSSVTYTFRQSFPLCGMLVNLFSVPHYPFGIRLSRRVDGRRLATFNARNEHDRCKFAEDLRESIAEMDDMEAMRIEGELNRGKGRAQGGAARNGEY
uniref:SEC7 domain-containing protein n=1 Tax=Heliothis virescens TaxID=7102 RepID=A0A2A4JVP1_HELVI